MITLTPCRLELEPILTPREDVPRQILEGGWNLELVGVWKDEAMAALRYQYRGRHERGGATGDTADLIFAFYIDLTKTTEPTRETIWLEFRRVHTAARRRRRGPINGKGYSIANAVANAIEEQMIADGGGAATQGG